MGRSGGGSIESPFWRPGSSTYGARRSLGTAERVAFGRQTPTLAGSAVEIPTDVSCRTSARARAAVIEGPSSKVTRFALPAVSHLAELVFPVPRLSSGAEARKSSLDSPGAPYPAAFLPTGHGSKLLDRVDQPVLASLIQMVSERARIFVPGREAMHAA